MAGCGKIEQFEVVQKLIGSLPPPEIDATEPPESRVNRI